MTVRRPHESTADFAKRLNRRILISQGCFILSSLLTLILLGVGIYVAYHFIHKYW